MAITYVFNPFSGNFDAINTGGGSYWLDPVANYASLPAGDPDGATRIVLSEDAAYTYNQGSTTWVFTGKIKSGAVGSSPNANGYSVGVDNTLTLQPTDATHPGVVTTGAQTIAGTKTFSSTINADAGLDRSSSGTLSIGTSSNSSTINIGNSGATVNIQGTTLYENVTQLQVKDPLITLNKGGGIASAANSGIELEENSVITGYAETSADRNSWILKAPNTAGIATITPGVSGITLNQSSHDPVTLGTIGASPNANGASLSSQVLTLQPANGSFGGVLTAGTQTIAGAKTFTSAITAPSITLSDQSSLTGTQDTVQFYIKGYSTQGNDIFQIIKNDNTVLTHFTNTGAITTSGTVTADQIVDNGLTINTALISNGSKQLTSVSMTDGQLLIGSSSGAPAAANLTAGSGIVITNASNGITISASGATGDIALTSFSAANNQATPANVTGLAFSNGTVRSFDALVSVYVNATSSLYETFKLIGIQRGADWQMSATSVGDASGFTFSITSAGQVQYTSSSYAGFTAATVKFRAIVTSV